MCDQEIGPIATNVKHIKWPYEFNEEYYAQFYAQGYSDGTQFEEICRDR